MNYQVRVPHVFQVFPRVSNRVILNVNTTVYNMRSNVDNERIYIILEIYLSEKIGSDLIPCCDLPSFWPNLNVIMNKIGPSTYF